MGARGWCLTLFVVALVIGFVSVIIDMARKG